MAFRRRFGRRGGGFRRRAVARKEPIWIASAYFVTLPDSTQQQALFQLVGPEDYTPDYLTETQRLDKCTLVRTVGSFNLIPLIPDFTNGTVVTAWKGALFVAGDKQVDDGFANDPLQFSITNPSIFPTWCRDFAPMHVFWNGTFTRGNHLVGGSLTEFRPGFWHPPGVTGQVDWDVTVKRKMQGDDALFLLIDIIFAQNPSTEGDGGFIDVEARNLIMDQ